MKKRKFEIEKVDYIRCGQKDYYVIRINRMHFDSMRIADTFGLEYKTVNERVAEYNGQIVKQNGIIAMGDVPIGDVRFENPGDAQKMVDYLESILLMERLLK